MRFVTGREITTAAQPTAHRVTWFAPDRPVDGGTVFRRPDTEQSTEASRARPEHDAED